MSTINKNEYTTYTNIIIIIIIIIIVKQYTTTKNPPKQHHPPPKTANARPSAQCSPALQQHSLFIQPLRFAAPDVVPKGR